MAPDRAKKTPARPPATQSMVPSLFKSPWQVMAKISCLAQRVHNLLPVLPSIAKTPPKQGF